MGSGMIPRSQFNQRHIPTGTSVSDFDFIKTTAYENKCPLLEIAKFKVHRLIEHKIYIKDRETKVEYSRIPKIITEYTRSGIELENKIEYTYDKNSWIMVISGVKYLCTNGNLDLESNYLNLTDEELRIIQKQLDKAYKICFGDSEIEESELLKLNVDTLVRKEFRDRMWERYKCIQDKYLMSEDLSKLNKPFGQKIIESKNFVSDPINQNSIMQYFEANNYLVNTLATRGIRLDFGIGYICKERKTYRTKCVLLSRAALMERSSYKVIVFDEVSIQSFATIEMYDINIGTDIVKRDVIELPHKFRIIVLKLLSLTNIKSPDVLYNIGDIHKLRLQYFNEIDKENEYE